MTDNVSPESGKEPRADMSVVGIVVALGTALLFLPLLPFVVLAEIVAYVTDDESYEVAREVNYEQTAADPSSERT